MSPTSDEIFQWKKRHGQIFSVGFRDEEYVFRAVTISEYYDLSLHKNDFSSADTEDAIVKAALLYPQKLDSDSAPAGLVSTLAEEILNISGFNDAKYAKSLVEEYRQNADDVWVLMKAIIIAAMPAYAEEHLDSLSFEQLAKKVVLAEKILELQKASREGAEVKLEIIDPEEEMAKAEAQHRRELAMRKDGQALPHDPIASKLRQVL